LLAQQNSGPVMWEDGMKFQISGLLAVLAFAAACYQRPAGAADTASTPTESVLYSFCSQSNCADGTGPVGLIADASGNLLGTTDGGGRVSSIAPDGGGTVFEIAKTASGYASTPTILYSFCSQKNCTDGAGPEAGLTTDANGNLFGTTVAGGTGQDGTVFEIVKTAGGYASTPTTLYSFFCSVSNCTGLVPNAVLIADASGNLFGTTLEGGSSLKGTVFELVNDGGGSYTLTTLYSFCAQTNCTDGSEPAAGLIADASGNLFGTTSEGGANDKGTVFEIAKTAIGYASTPTILYSFCGKTNCTDGSEPAAGLIADASGNLFGTTLEGGGNSGGTVFEIAKTTGGYASTVTILYSFCSQRNCADGALPSAAVIADASGNLFGTTASGGANGKDRGTVFEIAKTASGYASTATILYSFCSQSNCTDGSEPKAG
jgi:uncharacterized repeat protein (TIGR03803 family)